VSIGTKYGCDLQFDQLLQAVAHQLWDQLPSCVAIEYRRQGRRVRMFGHVRLGGSQTRVTGLPTPFKTGR
jgi:hypothetical protein